METAQIKDQLENHLLVAIDEIASQDISCQDCFDRGEDSEDGDECESTSIEAINQALIKITKLEDTLERIINELNPAAANASDHIADPGYGYPGATGMLLSRIKWVIKRAQGVVPDFEPKEWDGMPEFIRTEWPAS